MARPRTLAEFSQVTPVELLVTHLALSAAMRQKAIFIFNDQKFEKRFKYHTFTKKERKGPDS